MPAGTTPRRPVLPAIEDQNSFQAPAANEWKVLPSPYLEKLGREIKSQVDTDYFDVHSVPDVWARPLLFQMALYDERHPLHDRTVGEWRGLAALLALTDWRPPGQRLDALVVDFNDGAAFLDAARRVAPSRTLFADTRWDSVYVLRYGGRAVGMTSPTTLFCTGADYAALGVPWFRGSRFYDPLNVPGPTGHVEPRLNDEERAAIAWWLERLRDELEGHAQFNETDSDLWDRLQGQFHSFLDDLGPAGAGYTLQKDALAISGGGAFRYIDEVPGKPGGTPETSDVLLVPSLESPSGPPLLILDRSIAEKWAVPTQDVRVWGGASLDSAVPGTGMVGPVNHLGGEVLGGAEWRDPSTFFLDEIVVVDGSQSFERDNVVLPSGSAAAKVSPLIPLTDELLCYLAPRDLVDRVTINETAGRGYEVALRLPLSGSRFGDGEFTVVKRYGEEKVRFLDDVPILEVWPNFTSPEWDTYFTLFVGTGASSFLSRPGGDGVRRTHRGGLGEVDREVTRTDSFPETLLCTSLDGQTPYGLLVLAQPPKAVGKGGAWTVGVDFGTTNTTVFYDDGAGRRALAFEDRLWHVTNAPSRTEQVRQWFFPAGDHEAPFRTLYSDDVNAPKDSAGEPVLDGHVLFLSPEAYQLNPGLFADAKSDLKWSNKAHDRILSRRFLDQVVLQARAEAVAAGVEAIAWTYSVPTSFSRSQGASTQAMWKGMVGAAREQTESMATAAYFYDKEGAHLASGAVCLDVGGMSTDIAVWSKNETRLQTSVRLASRDILVEAVRALPSVQQKVLKGTFDRVQGIETALAVQGGGLWDAVRVHEEEADVSFLRQQIALGFGGLLYYVGLLVRHLVGEEEIARGLPSVYIGGNGARMLHWVASGDFTEESPITELFSKLITTASALGEGPLTVRVTPEADMKREVGYGLVVGHDLRMDVRPVVLSGEAFSVGNVAREWDSVLTAEDVAAGTDVDAHLPALQTFIDTFNAYARGGDSVVAPVELGPGGLDFVKKAVDQRSEDLRGKDLSDIYVEPIFVTALRALLRERVRSFTTTRG